MAASQPQDTPQEELTKENQLLLALETTASAPSHGRLGQSWARYFLKWRDVNDDLIEKPDAAAFRAALDEEIKRLKAMLGALESLKPALDSNGDPDPGLKFWKDALRRDIADAERLKR